MDEELKRRRLDINKRLRCTMLLMTLGTIGAWAIIFNGVDNAFLMVDVMLMLLRAEEVERELLLTFGRLLISSCPTIIYFVGSHKLNELKKESEKLFDEETSYLSKKIFESKRPEIDEMLELSKTLSRRELMDLLNKTKAELLKAENNKKIKCKTKSPDELMLCYLQNGLEDILFPSVVDEKKDYARTRKK